jgi:hypothetical protein
VVGNIPTRAVSTLFCVPSELYVQESDIDWDWTELPSLRIGRVNEVVPEGQVSMVSPLHWDTWNQEYIYPDGSPGREIKLTGNIAIADLRLTARLMIDTGCQVSIVFQKRVDRGKVPREGSSTHINPNRKRIKLDGRPERLLPVSCDTHTR